MLSFVVLNIPEHELSTMTSIIPIVVLRIFLVHLLESEQLLCIDTSKSTLQTDPLFGTIIILG